MKTCVIFNPAAQGQKAERLERRLDVISRHAAIKPTAAAGDARRLAAEAIAEGCDTLVAAGGDGTINEVLNGIGDTNVFDRVRLGVLPLGTVNVFARELRIPLDLKKAWELILRGRYTRIDLGWAEYIKTEPGQNAARGADRLVHELPAEGSRGPGSLRSAGRRYFMQLAGAGLDARAIQLVEWRHKKNIGSLAYVAAGLRALREPQPKITVITNSRRLRGELVLVGNGRYYGGRMEVFAGANLRDGQLDVCVIPRVKTFAALSDIAYTVLSGRLPEGNVQRLRVAEFTVTAEPGAGFELDGEYAGRLPARFGVERERLRVIVP